MTENKDKGEMGLEGDGNQGRQRLGKPGHVQKRASYPARLAGGMFLGTRSGGGP